MPLSSNELPDVAGIVGAYFRDHGVEIADETVEDLLADAHSEPVARPEDAARFGELLSLGDEAFETVKFVINVAVVYLHGKEIWGFVFSRVKRNPAPVSGAFRTQLQALAASIQQSAAVASDARVRERLENAAKAVQGLLDPPG